MKIKIKNGQKFRPVDGELMSEQLISNIIDDLGGYSIKDKTYIVDKFQISFEVDNDDLVSQINIINLSNPLESMDQDEVSTLIDGIMQSI